MRTYTLSFLCALCLFTTLHMPGTSARFVGDMNDMFGGSGRTVDQVAILEMHNKLRRSVKPPASNMLKMEWNSEAADNAQKVKEAYSTGHSAEGSRTSAYSSCGENVFRSQTRQTWSAVTQSWYDEVKDLRYGIGAISNNPMGHFTQVVWYNSHQISMDSVYGNTQYAKPYENGEPCSDCLSDCKNKLCTCRFSDTQSNCKALQKKMAYLPWF